MGIGQNIKARRKELGISAETLAERLGVNPSTVYRYESGAIEKLDSAKLEPIAEALQTTPAHLMGWDTEDTAETADPKPRKWRMLSAGGLTLSDDQLDKIYQMAHLMYPDSFPLEDE